MQGIAIDGTTLHSASGAPPLAIDMAVVGTDYFDAMGIPV